MEVYPAVTQQNNRTVCPTPYQMSAVTHNFVFLLIKNRVKKRRFHAFQVKIVMK